MKILEFSPKCINFKMQLESEKEVHRIFMFAVFYRMFGQMATKLCMARQKMI